MPKNNSGYAVYLPNKNEIMFTQQLLNIKKPEDYVQFIAVFAHELCHAIKRKTVCSATI